MPAETTQEWDGLIARRIRETSIPETHQADAVLVGQRVSGMIAGAAKRDNPRRFQGVIIGVEAGDGMSHIAESANTSALRAGLRTVVFAANGSAADIEALIELVGLSNAVNAARRTGILAEARRVSRTRSIGIGAGIVALGVAVAVVNAVSGNGLTGSVIVPAAVVATVLAGLGGVSKLLDRLAAANRVNVQELAGSIRDSIAENRHIDFVHELVGVLDRASSRDCTVIDDYVRLNPIAKLFVDTYLSRRIQPDRVEVWIVIARHESGHVSRIWANSTGLEFGTLGTRLHAMKRYEQVRLTQVERQRLADHVGHAERRSLRTVGQICIGLDDDDVAPFRALVEEKFAGDATAMGLLYLLALTGTSGANLRWDHDVLRSALSSVGNTRRSKALAAMIPDASPTQIEAALHDLRTELSEYLGVGRTPLHSIQLRSDAAYAIVKNAAVWKVPPEGLGHLFWALFWHDFREHAEVDALYVDKTSQHLLRASHPARYENLIGLAAARGLTEQILNVMIATIDNALSCCCLADLENLLERALELSRADAGKNRSTRLRRLRRLAWTAYSVIGTDRVLDVIVAIDALPGPKTGRTTRERPGTAAQRVYFASLGRSGPAIPPMTHSPMLDAATDVNLTCNGAWLSLTAVPLLDGLAGPLDDAAAEAFRDLPGLVDDLLSSEQDRMDSWDEIDYLAMSAGLWCWSLTGRHSNHREWRAPRAESLAAALDGCVYALATQEKIRRDSGGKDRAEFVVDGLGQDLLLAVASSTLVALHSWRTSGPPENRQRLFDVLWHCVDELYLGLSPDEEDISAAEQLSKIAVAVLLRMDLLRGAFASLGFSQLSANLALRRVQLAGLVAPREDPAQHPTMALHDELARSDRVGLLARFIAASVERSSNVCASALLTGVELAIDRCPEDDLVVELCRITVLVGNSFPLAWDKMLGYLVEDDDDGVSRLSSWVETVPLQSLAEVSRQFLNVGSYVPSRFDTMVALFRRRIELVDDELQALELAIVLEPYEIQARTARGVENNIGAFLDIWLPHKDMRRFPFLLYCLANDRDALRDLQLSDAILTVTAEYKHYLNSTGIVLLLWRLHERRNELSDPLRRYTQEGSWSEDLHQCIDVLDEKISPDFNFSIYDHLARVDGAHVDQLRERRNHWHAKHLELEEAVRLNQMIHEGRYARLLQYWANVLRIYDLRTFEESYGDELRERWSTQHRLVRLGHNPAVSAQFLRDVDTTFRAGLNDQSLQEIRVQLDEQARDSLPSLFETMKSLPNVPQQIRSILRRHHRLVVDRISQGHGQLVSRT